MGSLAGATFASAGSYLTVSLGSLKVVPNLAAPNVHRAPIVTSRHQKDASTAPIIIVMSSKPLRLSVDAWLYSQWPLLDVTTPCMSVMHNRIVAIPLAHLSERSFELPPRSQPLVVYVAERDVDAVLDMLLGHSRQQRPWNVTGILVDSADTRAQLDALAATAARPTTRPRLWQPSPLVECVLGPMLRERPGPLQIWDWGAGIGRDVAHLGELMRQSATIVAMDHRYRTLATRQQALDFFQRHQVEVMASCRCVDLTDVVAALRGVDEVDVVYAVRYWNRPLVEGLVRQAPTGLVFGLEHFCLDDMNGQEWTWDHPKVSECERCNGCVGRTYRSANSRHFHARRPRMLFDGAICWQCLPIGPFFAIK